MILEAREQQKVAQDFVMAEVAPILVLQIKNKQNSDMTWQR